jgi:hypothetical protein
METFIRQLNRIFWLILLQCASVLAIAQPPTLWQRVLNTTTDLPSHGQPVAFLSRLATADKGLILVLKAATPFLVKLDNTGQISWTKEFTGENGINSISETKDGNLLVVGTKQATPEIITLFTSILGADGTTRAYNVLYQADKQISFLTRALTSDGGLLMSILLLVAHPPQVHPVSPISSSLIRMENRSGKKAMAPLIIFKRRDPTTTS